MSDQFDIPTHGGRREGSGAKAGVSKKLREALERGEVDLFSEDTQDQTATAVKYAKSRARKEEADANLKELDYKIKSGAYISREAVREASATLLSTVAQSLRSLPDYMERKFGLSPEVTQEIEKLVDARLLELSQGLAMFSEEAQNDD